MGNIQLKFLGIIALKLTTGDGLIIEQATGL